MTTNFRTKDNISRNPSAALVILFFAVAIISFLLGCMARVYIISHGTKSVFNKPIQGRTTPLVANNSSNTSATTKHSYIKLPSPKLPRGKKAPISTTYSSKTFFKQVSVYASTSNTVHLSLKNSLKPMTTKNIVGNVEFPFRDGRACINRPMSVKQFNLSTTPIGLKTSHLDELDETVHYPSGQHLLVDIKNVDPSFLNSEERLAAAMVELVEEAKLTLLTYHCHSLVPVGVSCVGLLIESHIALHTWPNDGVISVDLYTCGSGKLLPILPTIKRLFGIRQVQGSVDRPKSQDQDETDMVWSHKLRGFKERSWTNVEQDFGEDVASKRFLGKRHLVSKETEYQEVDVIEVLDPRYESMAAYKRSLVNESSYEALHPELFQPNRLVFLDGRVQSSLKGESDYHEALVHPAMITHPNPKRVAIIGGGEGATLREVLKHSTVEKAFMIEIDAEEVEILREIIPEWSDCSDFTGGSGSCYDDSRAELMTTDAVKWFVDNFGKLGSDEDDTAKVSVERFDVIIMDALDPNDDIEFASGLYNSSSFEQSLMNALSDDGVFVTQLGQSPSHKDPADEVGVFAARAEMVNTLQQLGFESMHVYDDAHSELDSPWSYLVALKDRRLRSRWYRSAPELDIELRKRIRQTQSGIPALKVCDAPTMVSYQIPPKTFEVNYCRQLDVHEECKNPFDVCGAVIAPDDLQVRESLVGGKGAGRGLFAAVDIPTNSCLLVDGGSKSFQVSPSSWSVIERMNEIFHHKPGMKNVRRGLSALVTFITGYGYVSLVLGLPHWSVDSNIAFFMNHGCNQTYNFGDEYSSTTEINADSTRVPPDYDTSAEIYCPVIERNLRAYRSGPEHTLRDIKAGEEILANYLAFVADDEGWENDVLSIRSQCAGEALGEISEYEIEREDK